VPGCSVVIPCFNDAVRLEEALASLVAQSTADWEAIVVDDASVVGDVAGVVAALGDARVRSVRHEQNRGLAAARNTGIRMSTGRFILPFDCDDRLDPRCLETLVGVLDADPAADAVFPDFRLFGEATGIQRFQVASLATLLTRQWLPGPGCLYRRELWERIGGYCEDEVLRAGNEDWEFYVAAAEVGFVARHVSEPLYEYRVTGSSMSNRLQYTNHLTRNHIVQRHRALYERLGGRRRFQGEGYRASAQASLVRGERERALRLALRSLRIEPTRSGLWIVVRSVTPRWLIRAGRRLRGQPVAEAGLPPA
jgi:glycosyltransferase involved in cell wall biosynthesis